MITMAIFWSLVLWLFGANGDLRRVASIARVMVRNARQHESG